MDISIRGYIKSNFKDSSINEINDAIESSISSGAEEALPGIGVLFELLWNNSNEDERKNFLNKIKEGLK